MDMFTGGWYSEWSPWSESSRLEDERQALLDEEGRARNFDARQDEYIDSAQPGKMNACTNPRMYGTSDSKISQYRYVMRHQAPSHMAGTGVTVLANVFDGPENLIIAYALSKGYKAVKKGGQWAFKRIVRKPRGRQDLIDATEAEIKNLREGWVAQRPDCSVWAKNFVKKNGGTATFISPKKGRLGGTGVLPGDPSRDGAYAYHAFALKDGKLYDEFNVNGIDFNEWKKRFKELNNLTDDDINMIFDIGTTPPKGALK